MVKTYPLNMPPLFETERLHIRLMTREDDSFILRLFNAPNWLQFLPDRNIKTREEARRYIEDVYLKNYEDLGFGAWVVTLKTSGEPIGICGFFQRPYLALPDLGYSLLPAFEGMGYAGEAAGAALSYAGKELGKKELLAIVSEANTRSVRLLERLNFSYSHRLQLPDDKQVAVWRWGTPLPVITSPPPR
jgi:ribosomal-protein-alanine N-acetyltransferase